MPQLDRKLVKERAMLLRAKGAVSLQRRFASLVGTRQDVLVEEAGRGRTPCFAQVQFDNNAAAGEILSVRINRANRDQLEAEPIRA
jgi:tRNA A37 methylthiotransferase MiaB